MTIRATRGAFIRWLAAKDADEIVGECLQCATCPLAAFLASLEPGCVPHVDGTHWTRWEGEQPHRRMPEWATLVVWVADSLHSAQIDAGYLRAELGAQLGWAF